MVFKQDLLWSSNNGLVISHSVLLNWFFNLCVNLWDNCLICFSLVRGVLSFVERLCDEDIVVMNRDCMTLVPRFRFGSRSRFQPSSSINIFLYGRLVITMHRHDFLSVIWLDDVLVLYQVFHLSHHYLLLGGRH